MSAGIRHRFVGSGCEYASPDDTPQDLRLAYDAACDKGETLLARCEPSEQHLRENSGVGE